MKHSPSASSLALIFVGAFVVAVAGCPEVSQKPPTAAKKNASVTEEKPIEKRKALFAPSSPDQEQIFVDWPKPKLVLLLSGSMDGYIEPCGCAGLENQKGGLNRRHSLLLGMEKEGWPIVSLDLGGMIRRIGEQAIIKYRRGIDALRTMGYQAVGLNLNDLMLPSADMLSTLQPDTPTPFISANVSSVFEPDVLFREPYRVIERNGVKLGVTAILGDEQGERLAEQNADFVFVSPSEALPDILRLLEEKKCDHLILLAAATAEETAKLAQQFPQFDVVVAAGVSDPPPDQFSTLPDSDTHMVELSHKGMYVGVLGFFGNPQAPIRYQRVPLDSRFPNSEAMTQMLKDYQVELEQLGLDGLGLKPNPHPSGHKFVGSETCGECHTDAFEVWKNTPHSHATETLIHLDPPRHFDPECLSCHVTGWEPQEYFPYRAGFESLEATPHLRTNGCENCHGPGSAHVAAEEGDDVADADREKLRDQMRLSIAEAKKNNCLRCHDLDNSPDFKFEKYWPDVEHWGKD